MALERVAAEAANILLQEGGGGGFALVFIVILIIAVLSFALWLYVSYWVYKDANKRGENGTLWGAVVFLTGLLGIAVYFLAIRK